MSMLPLSTLKSALLREGLLERAVMRTLDDCPFVLPSVGRLIERSIRQRKKTSSDLRDILQKDGIPIETVSKIMKWLEKWLMCMVYRDANPISRDEMGKALAVCLYRCADQQDCNVAENLVLRRADLEQRWEGGTALMHASADVHKGIESSKGLGFRVRMVELLLFYNANVNARFESSAGETPLMLAAKEDRPDVMRALLSHKAHVDAFSRQGQTALSLAAHHGSTNSVAELLRLDAFAGYLIRGVHTAADIAIAKEKHEVVQLLQRHGWAVTACCQFFFQRLPNSTCGILSHFSGSVAFPRVLQEALHRSWARAQRVLITSRSALMNRLVTEMLKHPAVDAYAQRKLHGSILRWTLCQTFSEQFDSAGRCIHANSLLTDTGDSFEGHDCVASRRDRTNRKRTRQRA